MLRSSETVRMAKRHGVNGVCQALRWSGDTFPSPGMLDARMIA